MSPCYAIGVTPRSQSPFDRKLRSVIARLSSEHFGQSGQDESPVVYHYTDSRGLIGIVTDGRFWATDIHYLNDSSELLHAEEMFRQVVDQIDSEFPNGSAERTLANEARKYRSPFNEVMDTYVVCFSASDDMWTQWSTYGSRGSGFSIGFDRRKLEAIIQASWRPTEFKNLLKASILPKIHLAKVQYSEKHQTRALRRAFDAFIPLISAQRRQQDVSRCARALVNHVAHSASRYKHPCFVSEAEWRLIITALGGNSDLNFRPSRRTVVPFLKTVPSQDGKLPVVSITIGPTLQPELSQRSIRALLDSKRYFSEVEIKLSRLPIAALD